MSCCSVSRPEVTQHSGGNVDTNNVENVTDEIRVDNDDDKPEEEREAVVRSDVIKRLERSFF